MFAERSLCWKLGPAHVRLPSELKYRRAQLHLAIVYACGSARASHGRAGHSSAAALRALRGELLRHGLLHHGFFCRVLGRGVLLRGVLLRRRRLSAGRHSLLPRRLLGDSPAAFVSIGCGGRYGARTCSQVQAGRQPAQRRSAALAATSRATPVASDCDRRPEVAGTLDAAGSRPLAQCRWHSPSPRPPAPRQAVWRCRCAPPRPAALLKPLLVVVRPHVVATHRCPR